MANRMSSSLRAATVVAAATAVTAPALAQTTVRSAPVGVMAETLDAGKSGLALPLIPPELFVGVVASHEDAVLSFPASAGNIGSLISATGKYYVEVVTGPLEGERFDVDAPATVAAADARVFLLLGAGTHSTLSEIPADALDGARGVIRAHATLASVQAMFTPGLVGSDNPRLADTVQLVEDGDLRMYYLRADGARWSRVNPTGDRADANIDHRSKVLPADASLLVDVHAGQGWLHAGKVRANAFRKNLGPGLQAFATGFPVDLSPAQVGAFVDAGQPAGVRWTGSDKVPLADQFGVVSPESQVLYYLAGDGTTWRTPDDPTDVANQPILGATQLILLRRILPNPAYLIPRPFGL
jgi:hypothetical protein